MIDNAGEITNALPITMMQFDALSLNSIKICHVFIYNVPSITLANEENLDVPSST